MPLIPPLSLLLRHSPAAVLRHAARIGDLREAGLGDSPQALAARRWDGVESEEQVRAAGCASIGDVRVCFGLGRR